MNIKNKQIYLTAVTNERYIPGVMALIRSLKEVQAKYDLAIMIPKNKSVDLERKIKDYGILDYSGVFILVKDNIEISHNFAIPEVVEQKYSYWKESFFKIQAVGCTEFSKIILLDCDQMVVKNIDHLFDALTLTATICGKCVHPDWGGLSAGLVVIEPSEELYQKLLSNIIPAIEFKYSKGQQAGDQDVFQLTFPEWRYSQELHISERYNICWAWIQDLCSVEKCCPKDFYMVHFPGKEKPWDYGRIYYIYLFISLLIHGKTDKLFYKIMIWRKYRNLCERK